MKYVRLGRTGLKVSVAGLGCGGHSKLGQRQGASIASSVKLIHQAIDLGINVIDTADTGNIEEIVGQAIVDRRDAVSIATKLHPSKKLGDVVDAPRLRSYVEAALKRLRTDRIDIFYLHGIDPKEYDYCVAELVPEIQRLRDRGLIRFIGATESWTHVNDTAHVMLSRALRDDCWDVLMTGFNMLNQTATTTVLQQAIAKDIGIFVMYVVRDLLSKPELLQGAIKAAIDDGVLDARRIDPEDPLGFLIHEGGASSVVEAAYRFARHEPGVHVVLTGTGNVEHLRTNVASINRGPLPDADIGRLKELFGGLTYFSGNAKDALR